MRFARTTPAAHELMPGSATHSAIGPSFKPACSSLMPAKPMLAGLERSNASGRRVVVLIAQTQPPSVSLVSRASSFSRSSAAVSACLFAAVLLPRAARTPTQRAAHSQLPSSARC